MSTHILTEKQIVKTLGGRWVMTHGTPKSVLPGKWHAIEGGFFNLRLTGVERKVWQGPNDIPLWVNEMGIKNPERFSDKLIKKTNRHAVIVLASEDENSYILQNVPTDLHYMVDYDTWIEKSWSGQVDALELLPGILNSPVNQEGVWHIALVPVVLPDYLPELVPDEESIRPFDRNNLDCSQFRPVPNGNYDVLVFKHTYWFVKQRTLPIHKDPSDYNLAKPETKNEVILPVSKSNANAQYLDAEAAFDNSVTRLTSDCMHGDMRTAF